MLGKKSINKIVLSYIFIPLIIILMLYIVLPDILSYPPNSIDNAFQTEIDGLTYTQQFILLGALCFILSTWSLLRNIRKLTKNLAVLDQIDNKSKKQAVLDEITKLCFKTPLKIYRSQVITPLISIPVILLAIGADLFVVFKISFVFVLFMSLSAVLCYILSRKRFSKLLSEIYSSNSEMKNKILHLKPKLGIKGRLILELFPLIAIALFFTLLIAYVNICDVSGNIYHKDYLYKIEQVFGEQNIFKNKAEIQQKINESLNTGWLNEGHEIFIINAEGDYDTLYNTEMSEFFVKYTLEEKAQNRTYDYYGIDREGTYIKLNTLDGNSYFVGVSYQTSSASFTKILVLNIILMFILVYIMMYITKTISNDIDLVTMQLNKITRRNQVTNPLIITSNDEIGLLSDSFNKINNLTYEHIKEIEENQYVMQRQAQFSILGEFAGGLAHDLNSPLSAVKLDISTLKKYVNSDKITATPEIKEKLNYMFNNVETSLTSMGDIILSVRNQIRSTGDVPKSTFKLVDVLEGIKILFRSMFMKSNCQLVIDVPEDLEVYGEKNKLDRVLSNIIKNSLDAYSEKGIKGVIEVSAKQDKEKLIISIKDNAGGIPEEIKNTIFKEMKTTKKEKGTGFGLYYSNTIIESSFKGKMYFETEQNVGTTFFIELPIIKE